MKKCTIGVEIECDGKYCGKCKFLTKFFKQGEKTTKRCILNQDTDLVETLEGVQRSKKCTDSEI
jgi:hypothetical protein